MMAKPWRKRWPHVAKSGARSYAVGFYDHEGVERARSFPAAKTARDWIEDYITAERRGPDSLRRFLLDLDAREANAGGRYPDDRRGRPAVLRVQRPRYGGRSGDLDVPHLLAVGEPAPARA